VGDVNVFSLFPGDTGVGAAACRISAATMSTRADSGGGVHDRRRARRPPSARRKGNRAAGRVEGTTIEQHAAPLTIILRACSRFARRGCGDRASPERRRARRSQGGIGATLTRGAARRTWLDTSLKLYAEFERGVYNELKST
jgi:hypothetical protein